MLSGAVALLFEMLTVTAQILLTTGKAERILPFIQLKKKSIELLYYAYSGKDMWLLNSYV